MNLRVTCASVTPLRSELRLAPQEILMGKRSGWQKRRPRDDQEGRAIWGRDRSQKRTHLRKKHFKFGTRIN